MKEGNKTTALFCAVICLLMCGTTVRGQASEQERVTIKSIVGKAELRSGQNSNWRPVRVNMPVKMGWDLRTYVESSVELQYENGTLLKINENSVITLSKLYKESQANGGNSQIKVATGEVWGNVQKLMNKKSSFSFETPTAVASIRGTTVGVRSRGNRDTIECLEGAVEVRNKGSNRTVTLGARQQAVVEAGNNEISVSASTTTTDPTTGAAVDVPADTTAKDSAAADSTADSTATDSTAADTSQIDSSAIDTTGADTSEVDTSAEADTTGADTSEVDTTAEVDTTGADSARAMFLVISSPASGTIVSQTPATIKGTTLPGAKVSAGGGEVTANKEGVFVVTADLSLGTNDIAVTANADEGSKSASLIIEYRPRLTLQVKGVTNNMEIATEELVVDVVVSEGASYEILVNKNPDESPVTLMPGHNTVGVRAFDPWGGQTSQEFIVFYKKNLDMFLTITSPADGTKLSQPSVAVSGITLPGATVTVEGAPAAVNASGVFNARVALSPDAGPEYTIPIRSTLEGEEASEEITVTYDPALPLTVSSPTEGQEFDTTIIRVRGMTAPNARVTIDGRQVSVMNGAFSDVIHIPDESGEYTFEISATLAGKEITVDRSIIYEPKREPLKLELKTPSSGAVITQSPIRVSGVTSARATVRVNGRPATVFSNGSFTSDLPVSEREAGDFTIDVDAMTEDEDLSKSVTVEVGITSPSINISKPQVVVVNASMRASRTEDLTVQALDRTPGDELTLQVEINGGSVDEYTVEPNSYERVKLEEGKNTFVVKARDLAGNISNVVAGERYFLPGPLEIQINEPASNPYIIDDLPPMPRNLRGNIETDIEIEIEDQIGNVPETILYVRVQGMGQSIQLLKNPNYIYTGKLKLVRGTNQFVIEVEDIAGNKKSQVLTISIAD